MNEEARSDFNIKTWIFGLLTGIGVAAPVTAFFVKKIYDKKNPEEISREPKTGLPEVSTAIYEGNIPSAEEINNYDLDIDDEEATERSEIAVEDQERYSDMLQRYNGDLSELPFIIDQEQFYNDMTNEKSYINWYEDDNKFEEDLVVTQNPSLSFGVSDGNDLFNANRGKDPDIVYVRNNKQATDYEITRVHGSYKDFVEGTSGIGQADRDN